jgi:hypothetical protein
MNNTTLPINRAHPGLAAADASPYTPNQQEISPDSRRRLPFAFGRAFRWLTAGAALALLLSANLAEADTFFFDDGDTHYINDATYQNDTLYVANRTTLIIEPGAVLGGGGTSSGRVYALDTSTVTINGGTFGGEGDFSGQVLAYYSTTVTINGGTFGGEGDASGQVLAYYGATITFRASSFDTTSYNSTAGGTLGVTFCGQLSQNISVQIVSATVNLETVSCDTDGDGVPDDEDECPNSLDVGSTIKIGGTDTGVPNVVFENGCTISDMIADLADGAKNHGQFVRRVAALKNVLRKEGILTAEEAEALQSAAAQSSLP